MVQNFVKDCFNQNQLPEYITKADTHSVIEHAYNTWGLDPLNPEEVDNLINFYDQENKGSYNMDDVMLIMMPLVSQES